MIVIAIILLIFGVLGLLLSTMMFGDIGVATAVGAFTAILSGVGFLIVNSRLRKLN